MRISVATSAVAAALAATPTSATRQRSFVASTGSDGNPCTIGAPCRSFSAAIAQTSDGGEVILQDHAGYGPVTIATSVSLISVSAGSLGTTLIRDSQFANHGQAALRASGAGDVLTTTRNTFQEASVYKQESLSAIVSDGSNVGTGGSTGTLTLLTAF